MKISLRPCAAGRFCRGRLCLLQPDHVPAQGLEDGLDLVLGELGPSAAPGLHRVGVFIGVGGRQVLGIHLDMLRELPALETGDVQLQPVGGLPAAVDDEDVQLAFILAEGGRRVDEGKTLAENIAAYSSRS